MTRLTTAGWIAAAVVLAALAGAARADDVLVEGFETPGNIHATGGAAVVNGADAVTEGKSALQLPAQAAVTITIKARSLPRPGWLKIDTFGALPVASTLHLSAKDVGSARGYVKSGKDTLALPLGVLARTSTADWPKEDLALEIKNVGGEPVVLDNVRLSPPVAAPDGAVLLDFGPADQCLWPGFEHANADARDISWGDAENIHGYAVPFPDPLTGDFAGHGPGHKVTSSLTIQQDKGAGYAWIYLRRFGPNWGMPTEAGAVGNGKTLLQMAMPLAQATGTDGMLYGKDAPWTPEWFIATLCPMLVNRVELPLKTGGNSLDLLNCEVAAIVMGPAGQQQALRAYLTALDADLDRYRRQFTLGMQQRPVCDLAATDEETKAGLILLAPPAAEWWGSLYAAKPEHRTKKLTLATFSGGTARSALVAVPVNDGAVLQGRVDVLREPGGKSIVGVGKVVALECVPAVRDGCVTWQPFLQEPAFRTVKAKQICWFAVQVAVPEKTDTGNYTGTLRVTMGAIAAELPVTVEVTRVALPAAPMIVGMMNHLGAPSVCPWVSGAFSQQQRQAVSRAAITRAGECGFNCNLLGGISLGGMGDNKLYDDPLTNNLKDGTLIPNPAGRFLVNCEQTMRQLDGRNNIGSDRHCEMMGNLGRMVSSAIGNKLPSYGTYGGERMGDTQRQAKALEALGRAGGRPAVTAVTHQMLDMKPAERDSYLRAIDTLLLWPDRAGALQIGDELGKIDPAKALLVNVFGPDPYAIGFYDWAVGGAGVYVHGALSDNPPYNAFWFTGRQVLLPTATGDFQPTAGAILLGEGMDDYLLARRCELLVKAAKAGNVDASAVEAILTEIRTTCDAKPPNWDNQTLQSRAIPPETIQDWRARLTAAAAKITLPK